MPGIYPFNPYAENVVNDGVNDVTCRIVNELHTVNAAIGKNLAFIVPNAAPFFKQGLSSALTVRRASDNALLVEGTDYILTHRFNEASYATGKQIYGSIAFLNRNFTGQVKVTYVTLGGTWVRADNTIVYQRTNQLYSIHNVTWSQIDGMPVTFPPIVHDHDAEDLTGMVDLIAKLEQIKQTLITGYGDQTALLNALNTHIASPTAHSANQVGLGNVQNYAIAGTNDFDNNVVNKYATPFGVNYKIGTLGLQNGSTILFKNNGVDVSAGGTVDLKNGAYQTVTLPVDPPSPITANTLPLQNGAFMRFIVSNTPPPSPQPGTIWLKPLT